MMETIEIRTGRKPFVWLATVCAPLLAFSCFLIILPIATDIATRQLPKVLDFAFIIAGIAFAAFAMTGLLPLVKPRRLVLSSGGIAYFGIIRRRAWGWRQIEDVSEYIFRKLTLQIENETGKRASSYFLGPFWLVGKDEILKQAELRGWR